MEERTRKNYSGTIIVVSIIVNVALAAYSGYSLRQTADLREQVREITDLYNRLSEAYTDLADASRNLAQQLNMTITQREYYKDLAEYYSNITTDNGATTGIKGETSIPIVAVYQIGGWFQTELRGTIMTADIELRDGDGRALVNTVPKIGIDIQSSIRIAMIVAEEVTGASLSSTDVILTIISDQETEVVDGPSAGAAITVALISVITDAALNEGTYMTGTISSDGSIGPVGGIPEKALAAAERGATHFYVPQGQGTITIYVPKTINPFPGWTTTVYEQQQMDLSDYLREKGHDLTVEEVASIQNAYERFTTP